MKKSRGALGSRGTELLGTEDDSCLGKVVRGHLDRHLVAWDDANVVLPHLARDMPEDLDAILELDLKGRVREIFENFATHFDYVVFCHQYSMS